MIPLLLELEAFLPFRTHTVLDFSTVLDERLFLVTGNTGAGKTSVFDAICFALYGEASGSQRETSSLKSQFSDDSTECFVSFTFENKGKQYNIRRTPAQNKLRRNGNVTLEKPSAVLTLDNGDYLTKIPEVNQKIEELLGLSAEQFKKIVMLPQGEFRRFLSDSSRDKQDVLRKIFGTTSLDRFTDLLRDRYNELSAQLQQANMERTSLSSQIDPMDNDVLNALLQSEYPDFEQIVEQTQALVQAQTPHTQKVKKQKERLAKELHRIDLPGAQMLNHRIARYHQTAADVRELKALQPQIAEKRLLVQRLTAAQSLGFLRGNVQKTQQRLRQEQARLETYRKALSPFGEEKKQFEQTYRLLTEEGEHLPALTEQLTSDRELLKQFALLKERQSASSAAALQVNQLDAQCKCLALQGQITQITQQIALLGEGVHALELEQQAAQSARQAFNHWQNAYQQFLHAQAYLLSRELEDRQPCPVCGSTEHPSPAPMPMEGAPTKNELDLLSAAYERERSALEQAKTACASARAKLDLSEECFAKEYLAEKQTQLHTELEAVQCLLHDLQPEPTILEEAPEELEQALHQASAHWTELQAQTDALRKELEQQPLSEKELQARIAKTQQALDAHAKNISNAHAKLEAARTAYDRTAEALKQTEDLIRKTEDEQKKEQDRYQNALTTSAIAEPELLILLEKLPEFEALQTEVSQYDQTFAAKQQLLEENCAELEQAVPADLDALRQQEELLTNKLQKAEQAYEVLIKKLDTNRRMAERIKAITAQCAVLSQTYSEVAALYFTASGKNKEKLSFERYVLGAYFDLVVESANQRLLAMTDSRYYLRRRSEKEKGNAASGLDLEIFDAYSGQFRHVNTLSGGESFKTALCLALGLADVITRQSGGIEIRTVFIDEGFGTLDSQALENAVDCLYDLKDNGRVIGIISHVQELQEKIPVKLLVTQTKSGSTAQFVTGI